MIDVFQAVFAFVFALGLLITFHEFGHFWVARRCDVKILRFSVGFGRPIWKCNFGTDRSEFVIAALPLGGYVKMLDEREGEVPAAERHRAFNTRPLLQRCTIVAAGPAFNFLFAVCAYWLVYMVGVEGLKPVIGEIVADGPAARAGFRVGDEILRVDERRTPTWTSVIDIAVGRVVHGRTVEFTVGDRNGAERVVEYDLSRISVDD
ncbi:MAG: RIP metalloprotease RseP, partial [Gammaproteobacteria bacterium]